MSSAAHPPFLQGATRAAGASSVTLVTPLRKDKLMKLKKKETTQSQLARALLEMHDILVNMHNGDDGWGTDLIEWSDNHKHPLEEMLRNRVTSLDDDENIP